MFKGSLEEVGVAGVMFEVEVLADVRFLGDMVLEGCTAV